MDTKTELLNRKQFATVFPIDASKKGGAWQTELRHAKKYGDYEIVGKKYLVHEIYDTPRELIHGNTGSEPVNKGTFDENALKYKMAKILIEIKLNEYASKNGYLDEMGFKSKNMVNFNKLFENVKYNELDTLDKFAFDEVSNINVSMSRLVREAFKVISSGEFGKVEVYEQVFYVDVKNKHYEAEELGEDWEQFHALYKEVKKIAEENVQAQCGKKLAFTLKMKLENDEIESLVDENDKYLDLHKNKIKYFYSKYLIKDENEIKEVVFDFENFDYDGTDLEPEFVMSEDIAYELLQEFIEHRIDNAIKIDGNVDKFIKDGVTGDFFGREVMVEFVKLFIPFVFEGQQYSVFKKHYKEMIDEAKENHAEALEQNVEEQLPW